MPKTVDLLRPMAFRPIAQDVIPAQSFYQLDFPAHWRSRLIDVWRQADRNKSRPPGKVNLPTASLDQAIRAVVPDLIYVASLSQSSRGSWLYSSQPIPTDALLIIIRTWAEVCLRDSLANDANLMNILGSFRADELRWQVSQLQGGWRQHANSTAAPQGDAFAVLPYFLAAELTKQPLELDSQFLSLKRYPLSAGSSGAELMAWPPQWHTQGKRSGHFSPYVNLTLQNVPFQPDPVLYIHAGTRRFVDPSTNPQYTWDIKSAVMHTPVGWITGRDYEHSLQVASVQTRYNDEKQGQLQWDDSLVTIIERLRADFPLPKAHELLGNGSNHRYGTIDALLLHNTQVDGHAISAGISPANRSMLFEHLKKWMPAGWEPVTDLNRVSTSLSFGAKTPFLPQKSTKKQPLSIGTDLEEKEDEPKVSKLKPYDSTVAPTRCHRIQLAVGPVARLVCLYQNTATQKALITELTDLLDTAYDAQLGGFKTATGFTLYVHSEKAGELASVLDYSPASRFPGKQEAAYMSAKTTRHQEIAKRFPTLSSDSVSPGVLFELDGRNHFVRNVNLDPKQAIRQGFAAQGYLTQFIDADTKQEKSLAHRVRKSVLDLLRQWGVLPHPITFTKLPVQPKHYFGIWIIRLNSRFDKPQTEVPVAVWITDDTVRVKSIEFDWQPYADAQKRLATSPTLVQANERKEKILEWLRDTVNNLPDDTLLLVDTHNARNVWKSLQNKTLHKDRLIVGDNIPGNPPLLDKSLAECTGLRIVRLRQDKNNEAPQAFGVRNTTDGVVIAFAHGIFSIGDRVFASAGEKPDTAQVSAKSSKYGAYTTLFRNQEYHKEADPSGQVWNPRINELTMVGLQDGDDPTSWAMIVHQLRTVSLQFDDMITLPLPLHLASKLEEYVRI